MHPAFLPPPLPSRRHSPSVRHRILCCTPNLPVTPPNTLSYTQIFSTIARTLPLTTSPILTVDLPPPPRELSAGTLVPRFEHNLSILQSLLDHLAITSRTPLGPSVEIRDNINPQGGGEYLTDDECLTGWSGGGYSWLINAGVDAMTLKQVEKMGGEKGVVLLNCGLDRLSWWDRRKLKCLEGYQTLYFLKPVGGGWLMGCVDGWFAFWGGTCIKSFEERPKWFDVETLIRNTAARRVSQ